MRFKKAESNVLEPDMTPMIDIVFQLIAFFMLVTNFEQTQADERVKLPSSSIAKPPEVARDQELHLNIGFIRNNKGENIDPAPFVFLQGENLRVEQMADRFQAEKRVAKAKFPNEGASKITVIIRADSEVPTGIVQDLMKMAQEAEFEKFSFKAMQDTGD